MEGVCREGCVRRLEFGWFEEHTNVDANRSSIRESREGKHPRVMTEDKL